MRTLRLVPLLLLTAGLPVVGRAQNASSSVHPTTPPSVVAMRRTGPIVVDGRLDEAAWQAAQPISQVPHAQPPHSGPPTQPPPSAHPHACDRPSHRAPP